MPILLSQTKAGQFWLSHKGEQICSELRQSPRSLAHTIDRSRLKASKKLKHFVQSFSLIPRACTFALSVCARQKRRLKARDVQSEKRPSPKALPLRRLLSRSSYYQSTYVMPIFRRFACRCS